VLDTLKNSLVDLDRSGFSIPNGLFETQTPPAILAEASVIPAVKGTEDRADGKLLLTTVHASGKTEYRDADGKVLLTVGRAPEDAIEYRDADGKRLLIVATRDGVEYRDNSGKVLLKAVRTLAGVTEYRDADGKVLLTRGRTKVQLTSMGSSNEYRDADGKALLNIVSAPKRTEYRDADGNILLTRTDTHESVIRYEYRGADGKILIEAVFSPESVEYRSRDTAALSSILAKFAGDSPAAPAGVDADSWKLALSAARVGLFASGDSPVPLILFLQNSLPEPEAWKGPLNPLYMTKPWMRLPGTPGW
jgi:hypothetical protein